MSSALAAAAGLPVRKGSVTSCWPSLSIRKQAWPNHWTRVDMGGTLGGKTGLEPIRTRGTLLLCVILGVLSPWSDRLLAVRPMGDEGVEPTTLRCKHSVIPFHQSPSSCRYFPPMMLKSGLAIERGRLRTSVRNTRITAHGYE